MEEDRIEKGKEVIMKPGTAMVQPAVSADDALVQFKAFREIKERCLAKDDIIAIAGNPYITKTGWRKIKTIFNLSEEILQSKRIVDQDGTVRWVYRVRAMASNGAHADAEMACSDKEDFSWADRTHTKKKPESAIMAMAQTRAFNRAISDLVGGGEISAEEDPGYDENSKANSAKPAAKRDKKGAILSCVDCGQEVSQKVAEFSAQKCGKILCFNCQKKADSTSEVVM